MPILRIIIILFFVIVPLLADACYAFLALDNQNLAFSITPYLRTDVVTWRNVVTLDSANSDDKTTYLGIDYSLGFDLEFKNDGPQFYVKLERNGPYDYDAPLFIENTLMTYGGAIQRYRNKELLPQVEEFWLDIPFLGSARFRSGLYLYEVGNGFSLNGSYENYGATLYQDSGDFSWRLYYCRPDIVYKIHRGPVISQEEEQGMYYEPNAANFFSLDAKFKFDKHSLWPYIGVITDYTSPGKRFNIFSAPVKKEILGTFGVAWDYSNEILSLKAEAARNFGKAVSINSDFKDVEHTGYLLYGEADLLLGKFTPYLKFLAASGNKVTPEMAQSGATTLTSGKNRAFSYFSPLNENLGDSVTSSNVDMLPIIAMGAGYGLNYGVPRPTTFSPGDFENLLMPCFGFGLEVNPKISVQFDFYYLSSFNKAVGMYLGRSKYLSRELGYETDLIVDYQLNKNILISFLGGYFIPGGYYKERRDDTGGSLLSPYLRGDGDADCAYQLELAFEITF